MTAEESIEGWDISPDGAGEWMPWGATGNARAKILAAADGYNVMLVEAEEGYTGGPHEHAFPEFLYLLDGELRNQGQAMTAGGAYAAATGSQHTDFEATKSARYISIFKI